MKATPTLRRLSLAPGALALCLASTPAPAEDARVTVTFADPQQYTDLRSTCVSRDADARGLTAPSSRDHLRYEKALLADWLRRELGQRAGS
jgi:hypothetical protein